MKRILTAIALVAAFGTAQAQHYHGGWHHGHRVHGAGWGNWVPALIIGGIAGAAIANRPAQAEPAPIIVQPAPQPGQMITCPPGTMPFERQGWVRNQYNQYIQSTYIECR